MCSGREIPKNWTFSGRNQEIPKEMEKIALIEEADCKLEAPTGCIQSFQLFSVTQKRISRRKKFKCVQHQFRWKRNKIGKNYFAKFETFSALRGIYKLGSVKRLDEAFYNEMKKKENLFCKILFYRLQSKNIILWKIQTLQIWAADRLGSCFLLIPASPDLNVAWILSLIIFFFVTRSFFFFAKANTRCY